MPGLRTGPLRCGSIEYSRCQPFGFRLVGEQGDNSWLCDSQGSSGYQDLLDEVTE